MSALKPRVQALARHPARDYGRFALDSLRMSMLCLGIPAVGFAATYRFLNLRLGHRPRALNRPEALARIGSCHAAQRRFPLATNCLHGSLLQFWALRGLGLDAHLQVTLEGGSPTSSGHAWITHDGLPLHEPRSLAADLDITAEVLSR